MQLYDGKELRRFYFLFSFSLVAYNFYLWGQVANLKGFAAIKGGASGLVLLLALLSGMSSGLVVLYFVYLFVSVVVFYCFRLVDSIGFEPQTVVYFSFLIAGVPFSLLLFYKIFVVWLICSLPLFPVICWGDRKSVV